MDTCVIKALIWVLPGLKRSMLYWSYTILQEIGVAMFL